MPRLKNSVRKKGIPPPVIIPTDENTLFCKKIDAFLKAINIPRTNMENIGHSILNGKLSEDYSLQLFFKLLSMCIQKENISFIDLSKMYYCIAIFDATRMGNLKTTEYKSCLMKHISEMNILTIPLLNTIQPYFSIHQFVLAVDYLRLQYPVFYKLISEPIKKNIF